MTAAAAYPQKCQKLNDSDGEILPLDGDAIEVFIVACNIPPRLVKSPGFRAFISYLNKDVDETVQEREDYGQNTTSKSPFQDSYFPCYLDLNK
jgi:hypothetical protein